jgi:hypothetical protein
MPDTAAQENYELLFHAYDIGPAGVAPLCNGKPMTKWVFAPGQPLTIKAIGPDLSGTAIKTIVLDFKALPGEPASPLGDGTNPHYEWHPGTPSVLIGESCSTWTFTATLKDSKGAEHHMPDPEFQVGDGSALG